MGTRIALFEGVRFAEHSKTFTLTSPLPVNIKRKKTRKTLQNLFTILLTAHEVSFNNKPIVFLIL